MKKFIVLLWIGLLAAFLPADCAAAVKLACLGDSITAGMGVETEEIRSLLESMGCSQYQGYLYSPAVPLQNLEEMLLEQKGNI